MQIIRETEFSLLISAAILLSLCAGPAFAKGGGGGHGGGSRSAPASAPAASSRAPGSNFNTVNGGGPTMATGKRVAGRGYGAGFGFGRGRGGGGYYPGYGNTGTSNSGVWGAGPQWGTGGTGGSPSYAGSSSGSSAGNLQVQTFNWPSSNGSSAPNISSARQLADPINQTASAQPALKTAPIDDLLQATSK